MQKQGTKQRKIIENEHVAIFFESLPSRQHPIKLFSTLLAAQFRSFFYTNIRYFGKQYSRIFSTITESATHTYSGIPHQLMIFSATIQQKVSFTE